MRIGRFVMGYQKEKQQFGFSALQLGASLAIEYPGLHLWLQLGHSLRTLMIGIAKRDPEPSLTEPATPATVDTHRPITNPSAFWGGFQGPGEA
jgi:hypothetical protein